jgi:hypothetical protein
VTADFRLEGGGNVYEEICADCMGAAFNGRMRSHVWHWRPDWTCSSTAAVRTCGSAAGDANAIADRQSIQSQHCAAAELSIAVTLNAKHHIFGPKREFLNIKYRSQR